MSQKEVLLGGQAVIEGVMMRGPGMVATAVRRGDGTIVIKKAPFTPIAERSRLWRLPVLRGAAGLLEMLTLGIRTLNWSAEIALAGEDSDPAPAGAKKDFWQVGITVVVALAVAIALFFITPIVLTSWLFNVTQDPFLFNLTAGLIRLGIFIGYLTMIAQLKDVKRLFMYHGAEHKTVFAYEKEHTLDAAVAARHTRFHPRCGTSFLLVVMLVAILLFAVLDTVLVGVLGRITLPVRLITHLLLLPAVGGTSYEVIRFAARHTGTVWGRMAVAPGLWLQRITTSEPDMPQLEVAVAALRAALGQDEALSSTPEPARMHRVAAS